jgi:hypothetical protein
MDWSGKQATAKKLLDKFGISIQVIVNTPSAYVATTDTVTTTVATYDTIAVITNPTMIGPEGVRGRSDQMRLLINGTDVPNLEEADFYVILDSVQIQPDKVSTVKPGGDIILYMIDMK